MAISSWLANLLLARIDSLAFLLTPNASNFWSHSSWKMELEALPVRNCMKFCMHINDSTPPPERRHRKISGQERLNLDSTGSLAKAGHMFMSTWKTMATYNGKDMAKRPLTAFLCSLNVDPIAHREFLHQGCRVLSGDDIPHIAPLVLGAPSGPTGHLHVFLGTGFEIAGVSAKSMLTLHSNC